MTTAIQLGTMTRSQRRERIESLVEQIKAAEQEEVKAATVEQSLQDEQLRNVVAGVRGFGF
jgi:cell division FtsZ-interacting protein ZapD